MQANRSKIQLGRMVGELESRLNASYLGHSSKIFRNGERLIKGVRQANSVRSLEHMLNTNFRRRRHVD